MVELIDLDVDLYSDLFPQNVELVYLRDDSLRLEDFVEAPVHNVRVMMVEEVIVHNIVIQLVI